MRPTGGIRIELREVALGQTIEPERAGLVTELLGHRMHSLAPPGSLMPGMIGWIVSRGHANRQPCGYRPACVLISILQTRHSPQSPRPAIIRIATGGPTCLIRCLSSSHQPG